MAQLRQDYEQFTAQHAEILVVGPEDQAAFQDYWQKNDLPFVGLPDPTHTVADLYGQEVKILKFGRLPAMVIIDQAGQIRYQHHGHSMRDIPENQVVLDLLQEMNQSGV